MHCYVCYSYRIYSLLSKISSEIKFLNSGYLSSGQASYIMGTGPFPGVKRPGCGVDQPPPSSAEVKERVKLYLYSTSGPSWPVMRGTLPFIIRTLCSYVSKDVRIRGYFSQPTRAPEQKSWETLAYGIHWKSPHTVLRKLSFIMDQCGWHCTTCTESPHVEPLKHLSCNTFANNQRQKNRQPPQKATLFIS